MRMTSRPAASGTAFSGKTFDGLLYTPAASPDASSYLRDALAAGGELRPAPLDHPQEETRPADDDDDRGPRRGAAAGRAGEHVARRIARRDHPAGSRRHARSGAALLVALVG